MTAGRIEGGGVDAEWRHVTRVRTAGRRAGVDEAVARHATEVESGKQVERAAADVVKLQRRDPAIAPAAGERPRRLERDGTGHEVDRQRLVAETRHRNDA